MIDHISIHNFAIIENTEIDFEDGLSVITGETGAGKSIVIEAVSLALGSRADSSFVRHGADKAVIQLAATLDGEEIIITREISASGKNLCRLNGQLVTLGELASVACRIADIHGQYDNQKLLDPERHLELVDSFRADITGSARADFDAAYADYKAARTKLDALLSSERDNKRKLDFYSFEKTEIDNAQLIPGEDAELTDRISLLQNSEKIFAAVETAYGLLDGDDGNALSIMGEAQQALQSVSSYSKELADLSSQFDDFFYGIQDINNALRGVKDDITFTPGELDSAIARLDLIDALKKKYGASIEDILAYRDKITAELDQIENFDDLLTELESATRASLSVLRERTVLLTAARRQVADELSSAIEQELVDLNFNDSTFRIQISPAPAIGPDGGDICEIMISTNRGEPLKPLVKIASGGEISRIMLAIKNVTGSYDNIPTMIFDEIDAGISGITASIVARKLKQISRAHQIICITHLPQIAAAGDANYRIYKDSDESSTYTHVDRLTAAEKTDEIARLLGGDTITETTRKSAEELIERS